MRIMMQMSAVIAGTLFSSLRLSAGTPVPESEQQWHIPRSAHLVTRWGRAVNPTSVHSEYPRPQFVRAEWKNLNGIWQYAQARENEAPPHGKDLAGRILVPFPIESALSGVMKSAERLWYRRTVEIPKSWTGRRVLLHFGAVDWEATVFVNGTLVGSHRGGYDPFSFDITDLLVAGNRQELIVGVYDPTDAGEQARGKQVHKPEGIWYTSTTGIWQTVWLEPVGTTHITGLEITPSLDSASLRVASRIVGGSGREAVRISARSRGVTLASASGDSVVSLSIPSPHLWSPRDPFLYDLTVELVRDGKVIDSAGSYFAMRSVSLGKDSRGVTRILLNGQFVMQVGPLDQGFWPDGLYTAPSDEALKYDIIMMKKLGFNMARKHVKVEPDRWYYWADRLGLLVWQDMPSATNKSTEARTQFEAELTRMIESRRNHPSIIMWVVFNEGWGQYDTERLTAWVKHLDSSRLVNNASGWDDRHSGDVMDIHSYPRPQSPKADSTRAIVLGEFGGLGLALPGHTWKKEHWGYQGMANRSELTAKYETFLHRVYQFADDPGLSAAVYTQITDVEVECNGLLTYDRAVVKPVLARIAAANQGDFSHLPPPPIVRVVVPTSESQPQEWLYTLEKPGDRWFTMDFDAAQWKKGLGGFGTEETPGAVVRTEWNTQDIWLRRTIDIAAVRFTSLHVRIHHDDDAELYINGVAAGRFGGFTSEYEEVRLSREAVRLLKAGTNILALHCRQTRGGQYIDAGIVDVLPPEPTRGK